MLLIMSTQADAIADVLARRFKLDSSPTLAARTLASEPVAFTRLHSAVAMRGRSLSVPEEDAFALQVPLSHSFFTEIWTSGGFRRELHATPGDVYLFDLSCNPRVGLATPVRYPARLCLASNIGPARRRPGTAARGGPHNPFLRSSRPASL